MRFNISTLRSEYEDSEINKAKIIEIAACMVSISYGVHVSAKLTPFGTAMGFSPFETLPTFDKGKGVFGLFGCIGVCTKVINSMLYQKLLPYKQNPITTLNEKGIFNI